MLKSGHLTLTPSGFQSERRIMTIDLGEQLIPPLEKLKITPMVMFPAQPLTPKEEKSRGQSAASSCDPKSEGSN
ncbi:hypothetical protein QTO34_017035 [Cnephaeus nilssonii]|uniref:Uncharacterized protein n=1 Tax=Cnephaeus nilssonii TaxID=3371016 RepID=A0AA40I0D4_CNENI|nr:hypothetical protein QTO34_017035 [Eptesicus nilssonii]